MPKADRASVWLVDLGWAGKVRPAVILNVPLDPLDRALYTLVPATTSLRGSRQEIALNPPFLRQRGAFDVQQIQTVTDARLIRKLGDLAPVQFSSIENAVRAWLGL